MDQITPTIARETAPFDYGAMDQATADEAQAVAARYRQRSKSYFMDTGRDLLAMKDKLEHGLFLRWVDAEMGLTPRTAQNFMQAAAQLGHKSETVSHLPAAVLYKLAASSTPAPVRAAVLSRLEAGETIQPKQILADIRAGAKADQDAIAKEKEATRRASLSDEQRAAEDALTKRSSKNARARENRTEALQQERRQKAADDRAIASTPAAYLIERLGAIEAAALFSRLSQGHILHEVVRMVAARSAIERAKAVEPVPVSVMKIQTYLRLSDYEYGQSEKADAEALAVEIERDGLLEPVVLFRPSRGGYGGEYELADGVRRYRAVVKVLKWSEIPARIAPDITDTEVASLDAAMNSAALALDA